MCAHKDSAPFHKTKNVLLWMLETTIYIYIYIYIHIHPAKTRAIIAKARLFKLTAQCAIIEIDYRRLHLPLEPVLEFP